MCKEKKKYDGQKEKNKRKNSQCLQNTTLGYSITRINGSKKKEEKIKYFTKDQPRSSVLNHEKNVHRKTEVSKKKSLRTIK